MSERPPGGPIDISQDPDLLKVARRGRRRYSQGSRGRRKRKARQALLRGTVVPMSVYTSTDEPPEELLRALNQLLRKTGLVVSYEGDIQRGSWFRSWRVRETRVGGLRKLARLAKKAERVGELRYIYAARAESDEHEANAVATVIASLDSVDSAVIQLSSMIIVKLNGELICRVLSETELQHLQSHPELLKAPSQLFHAISGQSIDKMTS